MRFLLPLDSRESIRVILRKYSDTFPLYDAIIEDLMNNDYKIKPGKGAEPRGIYPLGFSSRLLRYKIPAHPGGLSANCP